MSVIDRDVTQMGVGGFVVNVFYACSFKIIWQNSANQSKEGGGKGAGG